MRRPRGSWGWKIRAAALLGALVLGTTWAYAAGNVVPASRAGQHAQTITVNDVKPAQCAGLTLTTRISGSGGTITGTTGNDLILGSTLAETIKGGDGNDCILGGGGDDTIEGNNGTDVCIGGNGSDTIKTDPMAKCETVIQDA